MIERGDVVAFNSLTPNDTYRGRTAPLTSQRCILYIYSTNIGTEYFKHGKYRVSQEECARLRESVPYVKV